MAFKGLNSTMGIKQSRYILSELKHLDTLDQSKILLFLGPYINLYDITLWLFAPIFLKTDDLIELKFYMGPCNYKVQRTTQDGACHIVGFFFHYLLIVACGSANSQVCKGLEV